MGARIEIPVEIAERLRTELRHGGQLEIGGVMMGQCLEPDRFLVVDFTVDHGGGTVARFVRSLGAAVQALTQFFDRTAHDYRRFNYLGEWHSHPSFVPTPSSRDHGSVQSIADDVNVGANFVVLLIVKLAGPDSIEGSATIFRSGSIPEAAELIWREENENV